jgi:hypothetical protein
MLETIQNLNKYLEIKGKTLEGKPLYRLVWSDDQFEFRKGLFKEFLGETFLREFTGVKEVRKYNYIHSRYILERHFPPEYCNSAEIANPNYYEPVYVVQDRFGSYLEPNIKVLDFLISAAENSTATSEQELINNLKEKDEKEIQEIADALEVSELAVSLRMGESVAYSKGLKNASEYKQ